MLTSEPKLLVSNSSLPKHVILLVQITLALQHMHSKSMVHMDIKPDNIYIVDEDTYKLGDLGLAASSKASGHCSFEEGDAR